MAAVLDHGHGAVVSHWAAAALWRLPGFSFGRADVTRVRARSGRAGHLGRLHQVRLLAEAHVTTRRAIPVTTLPRTLFDLAAKLHQARMERLMDTVLAKAPGLLVVLHLLLEEIGKRGRPGTALMRAILEDRPPGYIPAESGLESRFAWLLAEAGEPALARQVDVGGQDWLGRVDFVDRSVGLVVEVDSTVHHSSRLDRLHDAARDACLLEAGWRRVLRITDDQVWRRPDEAVRLVRHARAELRRPLPTTH